MFPFTSLPYLLLDIASAVLIIGDPHRLAQRVLAALHRRVSALPTDGADAAGGRVLGEDRRRSARDRAVVSSCPTQIRRFYEVNIYIYIYYRIGRNGLDWSQLEQLLSLNHDILERCWVIIRIGPSAFRLERYDFR